MSKAWRNRCPEGHSNIESRQGRRYQCKSCDAIYAGEPLDATQHDFPVPERADVIETPTGEEVLGELRRREYNGRTEIKADDLGHQPSAAAHLRALRARGFVEKHSRARASTWRLTDTGHDVAKSDSLERDSNGQMLAGCQP